MMTVPGGKKKTFWALSAFDSCIKRVKRGENKRDAIYEITFSQYQDDGLSRVKRTEARCSTTFKTHIKKDKRY